MNCRCCGESNLSCVVSLGNSPLANNLLDNLSENEELYPLDLMYCSSCHFCQLSVVVPSDKMFKNYLYVSSTTKTFRDHFKTTAEHYINKFNLTNESLVVDIGSNDGVALKPLIEKGIRVVGIDPAVNVAKIANDNGVPTINSYFTKEISSQILEKYGKANLITASNVFAHTDTIVEITHSAFDILHEDGCFIVEVQYLLNTLKDLTFDNIYHEHVSYWSVLSITKFFENLGYVVVDVEFIDTHGGSIRVYVKRNGEKTSSVQQFINEELSFGLDKIQTYTDFFEKIKQIKTNVISNLEYYKQQNLLVVGYGSPAKATTALNYFGVTPELISYIVEDNKLKHNKIIPGVRIPIFSTEKLKLETPNVVIIMAWNFAKEIIQNNQELVNSGVTFVSIKDLQK